MQNKVLQIATERPYGLLRTHKYTGELDIQAIHTHMTKLTDNFFLTLHTLPSHYHLGDAFSFKKTETKIVSRSLKNWNIYQFVLSSKCAGPYLICKHLK